MRPRGIAVDAIWDEETRVYVATSGGLPGLVAEAANWKTLQTKLSILIPELFELNGGNGPSAEDTAEAALRYGQHHS